MSLMENGGISAADVAAVTRNNNGFGNFGDGGFFWIIILFLFAIFGNNGWGNGFGGGANNAAVPLIMQGQQQSEVQRVIDQQSTINGIDALQSQVATGFANAEVSRCNANMNILQTLNNNQAANAQSFNSVNSGIADLKYTVATENCADRNALSQSTQQITSNCDANYQKIMDKLCQLEMDGIKQNYESQLRAQTAQIQALQNDLQSARFQSSQTAQTAQILADNNNQTYQLEQYLAPVPKPAYIVQNPNCCSQPVYTGGCCGSRMIG